MTQAQQISTSGLPTFSIPINTVAYSVNEKREGPNIALGRAIRQMRKEAQLTQRDLARSVGIRVVLLRQIERGEVNVDWGTVRHLAYAIKVSLSDVFRLTEKFEADTGPG